MEWNQQEIQILAKLYATSKVSPPDPQGHAMYWALIGGALTTGWWVCDGPTDSLPVFSLVLIGVCGLFGYVGHKFAENRWKEYERVLRIAVEDLERGADLRELTRLF